ncbi:MAG: histidinol-phosphatase [Armatimonadetes bacterium]|nr:histidinol-phosphatase [Armatimonadota bacterium]
MFTSYHVHSTFSDGNNTVLEIVQAADAIGLDEIGISDHYVLLPNGETVCWSMPLDALDSYFASIAQAAQWASGRNLVVKYGLEVDFDPATVDQLNGILSGYRFDYIIGSVHFFDGFPIDECKERWDEITLRERDDLIRGYWNRIAQMARTGQYDIAAHLDLYKKFGHLPGVDISADISLALDAIAEAGMSVEINPSGWHKPVGEAYPSQMILVECKKRGIPILITSDAHTADDLTQDYDRASKLLRGIGAITSATYIRRNMIIDQG